MPNSELAFVAPDSFPVPALIPGDAKSTAQAELLRAEQLSFEYNAQLAFYAQAKAQQIDSLQASLQSTIHSQTAKLAAIEQQRPARWAGAQARITWQNQVAQLKACLAQPNADPKGWGRLPRTLAFMLTPCSMSSPLKSCVSIIRSSAVNGAPYNSSEKPLLAIFFGNFLSAEALETLFRWGRRPLVE